jgi:Ca2+-binding RTX toxin-like protein
MRLKVALALGASMLALPSSAGAAHVGQFATPSVQALEFGAAKGERNRVHVKIKRDSVTIVDAGAFVELDQGTDCTRTGVHRVVCPRYPLFVSLGDRDDTLDLAPGGAGLDHLRTHPLALQDDYENTDGRIREAATVYAGPGNDVVTGSRFRDWIAPGGGRDHVEGRGGPDTIVTGPDVKPDRLEGDGGIDTLRFGAPHVPVTVDLAAGTVRGGHAADRIAGIERVHGGGADDTLRGDDGANALYGEHGEDTIVGRGGNDLIVGDSPSSTNEFANTLMAGPGDDVLDARGVGRAPHTTTARCGPGRDRVAGEIDDLLAPSCEASVFRTPSSESVFTGVTPYYGVRTRTAPVAQDSDSVTFRVACPSRSVRRSDGCGVQVTLREPPRRDGNAATYGNGGAVIGPGERADVEVHLNAAGRDAVAAGERVAIRVHGFLIPEDGNPNPPPPVADQIDFGWQRALGP